MSKNKNIAVASGVLFVAACWSTILLPSAERWSLCFAALCGTFLFFYALKLLTDRLLDIKSHVSHMAYTSTRELALEQNAVAQVTARYPSCSIPTTGWSMRFSHLHLILSLLDDSRPTTVVEFGSGISTLLVASWFQELGRGRLVSIDHDPLWMQKTKAYVDREGLTDYVEMIESPLVERDDLDIPIYWYKSDRLSELPADIDMLIIDGPPAGKGDKRLNRYPAFPEVISNLSRKALVVVDDANRVGEKEVIALWMSRFPGFTLSFGGATNALAILERH